MKVEVKICGITNRDDALSSLDYGADYLGFVLYEKSPRSITAISLSALLDKLGRQCRAIGVFVNESRARVEAIASDCGLYAVQIHGDEPSSEFVDFPCHVWRAVKHVSGAWSPSPVVWKADRYVVDSSVGGVYGGTGVAADWGISGVFMKEHPAMLSGGMTPGNVADAIRIVRPLGVDVASGVEDAPGRKDTVKLQEFIKNVRTVEI
jgi:phosphoribosylanthranilate isomerase